MVSRATPKMGTHSTHNQFPLYSLGEVTFSTSRELPSRQRRDWSKSKNSVCRIPESRSPRPSARQLQADAGKIAAHLKHINRDAEMICRAVVIIAPTQQRQ